MNVFTDQYRFDDRYGDFKVAALRATNAGYFRFGENAMCYGRTSDGCVQSSAENDLYDVLRNVTVTGCDTALPFDPNEVVENLRYERYMESFAQARRGILAAFAKKSYYTFRPLMPVPFRKHLQRIYLKNWDQISFPSWPVDRTVENIFEQ